MKPQKAISLILGPLLFLVVYFILDLDGLSDEGRAVLATTCWVGLWWMTEAIAIEATAFLPIVLLPLTGAVSMKESTFPYANPLVFLFLGGFLIALAIEKHQLHKRIALNIIHQVGTNPNRIILGFMIATAFLSMWISNTATTLMMVPIAVSVIGHIKSGKRFSKALLLAIAYSASIGGMATLVGTPPNIVFAGVIRDTFQVEISFVEWMAFGLPFAIGMLILTWWVLTRLIFRFQNSSSTEQSIIQDKLKELGQMSVNEKRVLVVFAFTAFCWISRTYLLNLFVPLLNDTLIAMIGGLLLFVIPDTEGKKLLSWDETKKLPWGVLMLFGGGLSIANAFVQTDLANWIGSLMNELNGITLILLILIIAALVNFLTEFTSNVATASMVLPILAALAIAVHVHPYYLMVAAILASSCAFMLPVATPPNAIVFGSRKLEIKDMIKSGLLLNLLSILLITAFVYFIMPLIWDLDVKDFITN